MSDYKVDYAGIDSGTDTARVMSNQTGTAKSSLSKAKTILENESVFMGPVKDNIVQEVSSLESDFSAIETQYQSIGNYLQDANATYKTGDKDANSILNPTGSTKLSDGNVIDTTNPVAKANPYNLSDDDLKHLAYVAYREQGSVEGAKIELSLMANLYEKNKNKYSNVRDYVDNSGWFASGSRTGYEYPGDSYYDAAKEVLNDGNRYVPTNVVEHDCLSDITNVENGDINDRSSFVPGKTILSNRYGAKYVFVGFAPNGGDPFGYLV